jgi:hypothetical protein
VDFDRKKEDWINWSEELRRYRVERSMQCHEDPVMQAIEMRKCAADPAYWLGVWGWIYEPRAQREESDERPFVPYGFQVNTLMFFLRVLDERGAAADGVVSKSRDMGASWLMCAFALWGWLFQKPWQVRLISRNQDLVDNKSSDSLFWKLDFLWKRLPEWMMPEGFDPIGHRMKLTLINPANGNMIVGESTTSNAVRGGRATWVGYDEAAFIPDFDMAWAATANATNHRFAVSSESLEKGPHFYKLRTGSDMQHKPSVLTLDWWMHPQHDKTWLQEMKERFSANPEEYYAEVLRDPHTGSSTWVYPSANEKRVDSSIQYLNGNPVIVGIDPGFNDETAIVWMQHNIKTGKYEILNSYVNRRLPADFYGSILTGEPTPGEWSYTEEDYNLMAWVRLLPKATYYGDVYGDNTTGATLDSFYSRLRKFGVHVNVDRMPGSEVTPYRQSARSFKGRREALREMLPQVAFADTVGSRRVLRALQEHRFRPDDRPSQSPPKTPLHDWTSHLVSALEYVAVNIRMRKNVVGRALTVHSPRQRRGRAVSRFNEETTLWTR